MAVFSIIVPVYNVVAYIRECLNSIYTQDFLDYEVCIIDDGSEDGSEDICNEFAARYPKNTRLIHQRNQGVSAARNAGIDIAKGDFLWFVDADDWIEHGALKYLQTIINESHSDVVFFGGNKFTINHKFNFYKAATPKEFLQKKYSYWVSNMIFKKSIIQGNNLRYTVGMKMAEDLEFQYKYLSFCQSPIAIDYSLYNLRLREGSASRNQNSSKENVKCTLLFLSNMYHFMMERPGENFDWMSYRIEERFKSLLRSVSFSDNLYWGRLQRKFNVYFDKYSAMGFYNLRKSSLYIARMNLRLYCSMLYIYIKLSQIK